MTTDSITTSIGRLPVFHRLALGLVVMGLWALRPASRDYFAGRSLNRDTPVLVPEQ